MDSRILVEQARFRNLIESRSHRLPWIGCWVWDGCVNNRGYGQIRYMGKTMLAHRISYLCEYGELPACVLHVCDNPACVNPRHLIGGTQLDNMRDMSAKGRNRVARVRRKSPGGYRTKGGRVRKPLPITQNDVADILRRVQCGEKQKRVGMDYGLSQQQVSQVMSGKHWQFQGAQ